MKKCVVKLCISTVVLLPAAAHCEISEEVYCFDSSGAGSKNFGLHVLHDDAAKWSGAFVKYRGAKSAITLVLKNVDEEETSPQRSDQVTTTWYEVYGAKVSGEYEMMSQGANIYSMVYKNYETRKQVAFLFNPDAFGGSGKECVW